MGIIYPEVVAYHVNRCCADPRASVPSLWIKVAGGAGKGTLVSKLCAHTHTHTEPDTHLLTAICLLLGRNSAFGCHSYFTGTDFTKISMLTFTLNYHCT